jgi:hypothetical protein
MNNQLASAMATIALTAVLLVLALFHIERIQRLRLLACIMSGWQPTGRSGPLLTVR